MKILVVEDNPSICETLGLVLESFGHTPLLAQTHAEALGHLEREWPDAILLDLTLEGISGEEVYELIRERFGRVPPTAVLSAVQDGIKRVSRLPGALFLPKPYSIDGLIETLDRLQLPERHVTALAAP